jgi:hypothetical protein
MPNFSVGVVLEDFAPSDIVEVFLALLLEQKVLLVSHT